MEVLSRLPVSLKERMEMGQTMVRFPASPEEFFEMLAECEYRVEYHNGEIISIMAYASDPHEKILSNVIFQLRLLLDNLDYIVYPSNRPLVTPDYPSYYNADCMVVNGEAQLVRLEGTMDAVSNPVLIVEVLSDSTRNYDQGEKFTNYRRIPTLRQVIFIESTSRLVTVHRRMKQQNQWQFTDYTNPKVSIPILDEGTVLLSDFYKKINIEQLA